MSGEEEFCGHLLVICIDIHPIYWGRRTDITLSEVIQNALILGNAHIVQNPPNKVQFCHTSHKSN